MMNRDREQLKKVLYFGKKHEMWIIGEWGVYFNNDTVGVHKVIYIPTTTQYAMWHTSEHAFYAARRFDYLTNHFVIDGYLIREIKLITKWINEDINYFDIQKRFYYNGLLKGKYNVKGKCNEFECPY